MSMPLDDDMMIGQAERREFSTRRSRSGSVQNRLSQLLSRNSTIDPDLHPQGSDNATIASRPSRLQRSRTTLSNILSRRDHVSRSNSRLQRPASGGILGQRVSHVHRPGSDEQNFLLPRPNIPELDLNFDDTFASTSDPEPLRPTSTRRSSMRMPHTISDRLSGFRPDRGIRNMTSSLRRRRGNSPGRHRGEDQAAMLSRLLSVAAAATAATLMGDDHQAVSEARSITGDGEDGTFDGFLQALQNGRIASALRQGGTDSGEALDPASGQNAPLNFFRMFRFGTSANGPQGRRDNAGFERVGNQNGTDGTGENMVPIIIVGIRSITPGSNSSQEELPPFIDALGSFPSPLAPGIANHESIDSILRPPTNSTRFSHRRRASMGGISSFPSAYDNQRHHRSPDRGSRTWSTNSDAATFPRPPPATPASPSPELSRNTTRNTTPTHTRPSSMVSHNRSSFHENFSPVSTRRNSLLQRATPLSAHTEEGLTLHSDSSRTNLIGPPSQQPQDTPTRQRHRRRLSESDSASQTSGTHYPRFGSGSSRRNGVVEPDNADNNSRSWIIYVLGGSYPENHPILSTPSLFTDSPTYEDMMMLGSLLGPAKPPVATEEDVQDAGGLYNVVAKTKKEFDQQYQDVLESTTRRQLDIELAGFKAKDMNKNDNITVQRFDVEKSFAAADKVGSLKAVAVNGDFSVELEKEQRCLVCLCEFEAKDEARRLKGCGHLFHKECIDQVCRFL